MGEKKAKKSRERRAVPEVIDPEIGYFDRREFIKFFAERYPGEVVGSIRMARDCGIPRGTMRYMLDGNQPSLYTYVRVIAFLELPFGAFLSPTGIRGED